MRLATITALTIAGGSLAWSQAGQLKTVQAVLEKYQRALGGSDAIKKVQFETRHGELEESGTPGKVAFISYAKPFKALNKVTLPGGGEILSGFDGAVSWTVTPNGAVIDNTSPLEAIRRDADLQYPLHQPDYFQKYEITGVTDFEGRRCYRLHGITHWGKDNNQFYDADTGLLAGYRFQSDDVTSTAVTTLLFQDYKSFGGPLVATRSVARTGDHTQTITFTSVSYEWLSDFLFELPQAVKALLK